MALIDVEFYNAKHPDSPLIANWGQIDEDQVPKEGRSIRLKTGNQASAELIEGYVCRVVMMYAPYLDGDKECWSVTAQVYIKPANINDRLS